MIEKTYAGQLCYHTCGEEGQVLFLSTIEEPLAERLEEDISGKIVTVRYWLSDVQVSKEEAMLEFMKRISGSADAKFRQHYSEYTGYLWTDEECMIGGHDLIKELKGSIGKWLILEIDIHEVNEADERKQEGK